MILAGRLVGSNTSASLNAAAVPRKWETAMCRCQWTDKLISLSSPIRAYKALIVSPLKRGRTFAPLRGSLHFPSRTSGKPWAASSSVAQTDKTALTQKRSIEIILWFKHDLRTDDHPGLNRALELSRSSGCRVTPLFIFDPEILSALPDPVLSALSPSLADLQRQLWERYGLALKFRVGYCTDALNEEIAELSTRQHDEAKEVLVLLEEEVEDVWCEKAESAREGVGYSGGIVSFESWNTHWVQVREDGEKFTFPVSFEEYKSLFSARNNRSGVSLSVLPLEPPESDHQADVAHGIASQDLEPIPSKVEIMNIIFEHIGDEKGRSGNEFSAAKEQASNSKNGKGFLITENGKNGPSCISTKRFSEMSNEKKKWAQRFMLSQKVKTDPFARPPAIADVSTEDADLANALVSHGSTSAMEFLGGYFRVGEATSRSDWQRMYRLISPLESFRPLSSFPFLFSPAILPLGLISRRRILLESVLYERKRRGLSVDFSESESEGEEEREREKAVIRSMGWKSHPLPFLKLDFSSRTVEAAVAAVTSAQWHYELAADTLSSARREREGVEENEKERSGGVTLETRFWSWKGALIEYVVATSSKTSGTARSDSDEIFSQSLPRSLTPSRSPLLFVHGFGAFAMHYRDNMTVPSFSLTLPGFGRSSKPLFPLSQYVWAECVRDFLAERVGVEEGEREGAVLVGNSIGGYISSLVAAYHPSLVRSLVLLNTAGKLSTDGEKGTEREKERGGDKREFSAELLKERREMAVDEMKFQTGPPSFVVFLISRILLVYLKTDARKILKRCYPKFPDRADDWLLAEILRAAKDPNSLRVFESVFFLPKPVPLNILLEKFGKEVLVLQGRYDPLNDAVARAKALKKFVPSATVALLDAGHCPHDEVPESVNLAISQWMGDAWNEETESEESEEEREGAFTAPSLLSRSSLGPSDIVEILEEEALVGLLGRGTLSPNPSKSPSSSSSIMKKMKTKGG